MIKELKVPTIGESINEVTIASLLVENGDYVEMDQPICEFDTDKATLEFPAEVAGTVEFVVEEGDDLKIGDVVAKIDTSAEPPATVTKEEPAVDKKESVEEKKVEKKEVVKEEPVKQEVVKESVKAEPAGYAKGVPSPAADKLIRENGMDPASIKGSGKGGRITKADVVEALAGSASVQEVIKARQQFSREEKKEKLSRLRKTISKRLVSVKNETAMLTTFNEVNMGPVMDIRNKYKAQFEKAHDGTRLGFMSFFLKAAANALMEFPSVNAYFNDNEIILHEYADISIAVSTPRGLVVPVIRNAESLSMAELEQEVRNLAIKGRDGELTLEEMEGGTFTITNGGVFGSLMSTPIINAPQSAILGMHKIEDRPIAENGEVVIRPMMYLALSYDHRIIDGKESVSFLVRIKEQLENPEQLLLGSDPVEILLGL